MGKLLRQRDVMEALGVSRRKLMTIVESGMLDPIRIAGRKWMYRAADVRRLAGE